MANPASVVPLRQSPQTEQALIGGCLKFPDVIPVVAALVGPEDFYDVPRSWAFRAIVETSNRKMAPDETTVAQVLRDWNREQSVLGNLSLKQCWLRAGAQASVVIDHAKLVSILSAARRMGSAGEGIRLVVENREYTPDEAIAEAARLYAEASAARGRDGVWYDNADLAMADMEAIAKQMERGGLAGVTTGLRDLDETLGGHHPGTVTIVGARPSHGKSALTQFMHHAAAREGVRSYMICNEMPKGDVFRRNVCRVGQVSFDAVRRNQLSATTFVQYQQAAHELSLLQDKMLYRDDLESVEEICAAMLCERAKHPVKKGDKPWVIFVDFLQKIKTASTSGRDPNPDREMKIISNKFQALAKQLGAAVVLVSSLNRAAEKREDKRPSTADLRESGNIESDADTVLLLYCDQVVNKNPSSEERGIVEIDVAKNRNGPTTVLPVAFDGDFMQYRDLDDDSIFAWRSRRGFGPPAGQAARPAPPPGPRDSSPSIAPPPPDPRPDPGARVSMVQTRFPVVDELPPDDFGEG